MAGGLYSRLTERWLVSVVPAVGGSFYGDPDRDSFDLGARFGLRRALGERIDLRPGYAIVWEDAQADEFDRTAHVLSLALDAGVWRGGRVELATAVEFGQVPRYLDLDTTGGPSGGPAAPGSSPDTGGRDAAGRKLTSSFGTTQLVLRADATIADVRFDVEQRLARGLVLRAGAGYSYVSAAPAPYDAFSFSASLGVAWP